MGAYEFSVNMTDNVSGGVKSAIGGLSSFVSAMTGTSSAFTGGLDSLATSLGRVIAPAQQGRNELGQFTAAVGPLDDIMPGLAEGLGSVVAVLGAFAAATVGVIAAGASLALEMSSLKDKTLATLDALAGGPKAGAAMLSTIDSLTAKLGMTRAELAPMAEQMLAMGVSADKVAGQLTALASVKAIGVDGGTEEYLSILKKLQAQVPVSSKELANLYKTGVSVDEIAQAMGVSVKALEAGLKKGTVSAKDFQAALEKAVTAKGAAALEAQALELGNQWSLLKENLGHLFEDVNVKPFLEGLKSVLGLFSQDTASGKALKAGITWAFNAIFDVASKVWPYIKKAIELVIIAGLKVYIAFKPVIAAFRQLFDGVGSGINPLWAFSHILNGLVRYAQNAANGIMWLIHAVVAVENAFNHVKEIASNFIQGLVDGIKNGTGLVIDAVKNLGKSAMGALKGLLGIASPSKVMMEMGVHTGAGFAQGIDNSVPKVQGSVQKMTFKAIGGAGGAANTNAKGGKGGATVNIDSIHIDGAGKSAGEITEEMVSLTFERLALAQGL